MITPTYEMHTETMPFLLSCHDPLVEPLLSHSLRPTLFCIQMSSCFIMGDVFWTLISYSVTDVDDRDCTFSNRWFDVIWFFRLIIRSMPYWGIFRFGWDLQIFMELHDHPHLRDTRWDKDPFVILLWSSNGALLEPFSQARISRHSDVIILALLRCVFLIRGSDSVMDSNDEDRAPNDRWLEAIWFFWPITHLMPY